MNVVVVNRRGGRRLGDGGSRSGGSPGVGHGHRRCPGVGNAGGRHSGVEVAVEGLSLLIPWSLHVFARKPSRPLSHPGPSPATACSLRDRTVGISLHVSAGGNCMRSFAFDSCASFLESDAFSRRMLGRKVGRLSCCGG